ncbi:N-acetyltransferase family protein [Cytophagaceae bacterium YF14B1]|uniref:N-acetyltransferase family protein n=1 Tax=Xanthocytophaga flava TaxID=3048013 RepID=A0AAE3QWY9_9BACT|nr:GNAT family N-acetyltransferase [Xanthocytophaga flavus]MDJ1485045.1 N-acetyltransferase family protein [Xanthocytophaga flavus]
MELTIRDATSDDVPAILSIINHAIAHTTAVYDYQPRSLEVQQAWFDKKQVDNMPVLVADYQGKIIGFGSYGIFRPWEGYRFSVEHSIYVSEESRGKGVGKMLLEVLIDRARKQGFHTMIAGIDAENVVSCELHRKLGFQETGRLKEVGYKFDKWLDLAFMQLYL